MNWRKPIIFALLKITGSRIPSILKEIEKIDNSSKKDIEEYQKDKLEKILLHAWENVPYYTRVLEKAKVVVNGKVNLENFDKIPLLTKDIIRKEGKNLYSKDYKERGFYENTSGGSTGEPVKFIQDKDYYEWNTASKLYYNQVLGKDLGDSEINLWGSERDINKNSLSIKNNLINFIYNRTFLNAFKVNTYKLNKFVRIINKKKPVSMWVYVESIDNLANFIKLNNLQVYSPKLIISTAGTLYPEIRKNIENIFNCPVYNQYGSREVGPISFECKLKKGFHYFPGIHFIEVINNEIIITLQTNYSMPLIRYKIGDMCKKSKKRECDCGKNTLLLKSVSGRIINHFKTKKGDLIHGQLFIHLFYFKNWIKKFQIIQKDYNLIIIKIVGEQNKEMNEIENKIKILMGKNCKVQWDFVKEIKPTKSGKYLYTVCEIK